MLITDKKQLEKFYACHRFWQGIPGIERTAKGRTFVCFYSGKQYEGFGNFEALLMSDDLKDFGEPIAVAYNGEDSRCFDGVVWIDPLDRLWFIWNVQPENRAYAAICDEPDAQNLVWSQPFVIGNGIMINKPTVLRSGEWLFPLAIWNKDVYSNLRIVTDEKPAAYVYKTTDNGKTFIKLGGADLRGRIFDEHMILQLKNDVLMMLVRTDYGIGTAYSYDGGMNWTKGEDSGYGGPGSRFHIRRLSSGRVLLLNHYNFKGRNNLTALLSEDDGKTFKYSMVFDERDNISYPDAVEAADGYIYVVYDRERGYYKKNLKEVYSDARELLIAKFTEEDIIKGEIADKGSCLKIVASKLAEVVDSDPYTEIPMSDIEFAEQLIKENNENVVDYFFERFAYNCINIKNSDIKRFDKLVDKFVQTEKKDPEILAKIIGNIRKVSGNEESSLSSLIERCMQYISDNIATEFSISDLSEHLNISYHYLLHAFKTFTGTTIIEYRNELRMTNAKIMLIESDEKILNIANIVGFDDAAYFSKKFLEHEGISPTEYRRLHKK